MGNVISHGKRELSLDEHEELAWHIYAVENHVHRMLDILNGRARAKWLDYLLKYVNQRAFGKFRNALDRDYPSNGGTPYFGHQNEHPPCERPKTRSK